MIFTFSQIIYYQRHIKTARSSKTIEFSFFKRTQCCYKSFSDHWFVTYSRIYLRLFLMFWNILKVSNSIVQNVISHFQFTVKVLFTSLWVRVEIMFILLPFRTTVRHITDLSEIKVFVCFLLLSIYWSILIEIGRPWSSACQIKEGPTAALRKCHYSAMSFPWMWNFCDITRSVMSYNCFNTIICVIKIFALRWCL